MDHSANRQIQLLEDPATLAMPQPISIELHGDEFWPLSGKPYFHVVLNNTHCRLNYQLAIPSKTNVLLPSAVIPASIYFCGRIWEMVYDGKMCKRIYAGWRTFFMENNLQIGDALVFEVMESSSNGLKLRAQILRGELPIESTNGETAETAIIIS